LPGFVLYAHPWDAEWRRLVARGHYMQPEAVGSNPASATWYPCRGAEAMAPNRHRGGRPFRRAKAQMHALYGYVCVHCGHGGAGEADHVVPLSIDPNQPVDPTLMRPSHGSNYPCPVCPGLGPKGRACNQERGVRDMGAMFKPHWAW
jgi:hypothetical protein